MKTHRKLPVVVGGCVAVERGPLVMCVESVDLPEDHHVDSLEVDPSVPPRDVDGEVVVDAWIVGRDDAGWPYRGSDVEQEADGGSTMEVNLQPYHDWATRGPSTMRVWMPARRHASGTA